MAFFKRKRVEADITAEVAGFFGRWRTRTLTPDEAVEEKPKLAAGLLLKVAPAIFAAGKRLVGKFRKIKLARKITDAELQDRALVVAEGRVDVLANGLVDGTWGRVTNLREQLVELGRSIEGVRADQIQPATLEDIAAIQAKIEREFSDERANRIGITETTAAQTSGERMAADAFSERGVILEPTWRVGDQPCKTCGPLESLQQSDWPLEYQFGPPAHPVCQCWMQWRTEAETIPDDEGDE